MTDPTPDDVTLTTDPETGATIVSHNYPDTTPIAVTITASGEDAPRAGFTDALRNDALTLLAAGEPDKAMAVVAEATRLDQIAPNVEVRPLDADELAQLATDQQQAAAAAAAAAQAASDRAALVAKLSSGSASADEMQTALAQLLG